MFAQKAVPYFILVKLMTVQRIYIDVDVELSFSVLMHINKTNIMKLLKQILKNGPSRPI